MLNNAFVHIVSNQFLSIVDHTACTHVCRNVRSTKKVLKFLIFRYSKLKIFRRYTMHMRVSSKRQLWFELRDIQDCTYYNEKL